MTFNDHDHVKMKRENLLNACYFIFSKKKEKEICLIKYHNPYEFTNNFLIKFIGKQKER